MFRGDQFVTPLYLIQSPGAVPKGVGTGIWLKVGDEKFLITAAHVVDEGLLWFPMEKGFKSINSPCVVTSPTSEARSQDRVDLAVFHLVAEDVESKHPFHQFVQLSDVDVDLNYKRGDRYEFTGFPWRREKSNLAAKQTTPGYMSVNSETVSEDMFRMLRLSIHTHVVIAFDPKKMVKDGLRITAPLPHGMSGGAVWRRYPNTEQRKLSAVAIEFRRNCLIGSRISGVLEYIRARFPALSHHIPVASDVEIVTTQSIRRLEL